MIQHKDLANALRFLAAEGVQRANSGHPGMPMGMADVATVLFSKFLKFDASQPNWADRDRFILSAGHGSMLLYSLLYLTGYKQATLDELKRFRQLGSRCAGHPEYGHLEGIETTTGPLGQGISTAVGMAIAEKLLSARYGKEIVDHYTYVICGDGCLMEGISEEAISLAGHLKLNKMIVLWDDNKITIDGATSVATSTDHRKRFEANNWNTDECDAYNPDEIAAAIERAKKSDKPTLIACHSVIGYGAPKQGTSKVHGSPIGVDDLLVARKALGFEYDPFEVPDDILDEWRSFGRRGETVRKEWETRFENMPADKKAEFNRTVLNKVLPTGWKEKMQAYKEKLLAEKPKVATRKASQMALEELVPAISELLGGSADLTASNLTNAKASVSVKPDDFTGNYMHYGIREHGMAAAMNGIALHGGFIPYSGAFLVFMDYLKPSLRLAALMGIRVIYVLTHDSIGVGEDGPTHQPIEHLASMRAIPNVNVFRPCDVIETAECWELAIEAEHTPSVLALSRQNLPTLRNDVSENKCAKGAYVISDVKEKRDVTIIATGSEVEIAVKAQEILAGKGVDAAVVSMPCWELFDKQDAAYKAQVLGVCPRVAVESQGAFGWEKYVGLDGAVVAMTGFGASAPADLLYEHFGITPDHVAQEAMRILKK
ncbi:MAG: transketolase [Alphaproteobacteria bacterium]|nr:transketolase [Alphaproteobacteria bacterium]